MNTDELREWLGIFQSAFEQAETFPADSQAAITAKVLFACLAGAVHRAIVAKDTRK